MEGKPAIDRRQVGRNVVMTAAIAGLGGLLFGYDTGVVRSKAAAVGTMANGMFNFIVSLTFLLLIDALGRGGAFLFYAVICVVTFFFCKRLVPETKGMHLEDIQAFFQERVDSHDHRTPPADPARA